MSCVDLLCFAFLYITYMYCVQLWKALLADAILKLWYTHTHTLSELIMFYHLLNKIVSILSIKTPWPQLKQCLFAIYHTPLWGWYKEACIQACITYHACIHRRGWLDPCFLLSTSWLSNSFSNPYSHFFFFFYIYCWNKKERKKNYSHYIASRPRLMCLLVSLYYYYKST